MKRTIVAMFALLTCAVAFGKGYADWYTPAKKFSEQNYAVAFMVGDKIGAISKPLNANRATIRVALDSAVENMELSESAKNAFALAKEALVEAVYAEFLAEQSKQKIDSLGASVETIFQLTNADKVDSSGAVISSGKLADGVRGKMLAKKNALIGGGWTGGAGAEGGEDKPLQITVTDFHYDQREFEQIQMNGNKSKMGLKGFKDLRTATAEQNLDGSDDFALAQAGYHIPVSTKGDGDDAKLQWYKWNGWDASCFSAGDDGETGSQNNKPLHLRHWNGGDGGCGENLQNLLTNKNQSIAADRKKHYFLTRYGENNAQTHELHWLSMSEAAMEVSGGEPNVDDHSIVLAKDEDASPDDPKKLRLKGFDAAKSARTESGKVPIVPNIQPTGEDLAWTSFSDFFADSVFKTSDTTGKVLLNGTKEGDKKVQVLALQYGDTDDDQTLSSFSGDGVSIDLGFTPDGQTVESPLAQLHNFDNPERNGAKTEYDIADILTNVNHSTDGWYFPLRNAQGVLQYAQASKITGIPSASVDGKTIENTRDTDASETEPTKLRIFGSQTATEGQVLKMGKAGEVVWSDEADVAGLDCEPSAENQFPLYTNIVGGVVKFGLQNWETLDNVNGVYGKKEGNPVMWRMDDSRSLECDQTYDTIEVANSVTAANRAIPFKDKTNSGGDTIGWLAPPSSNPNGKYLKITGTGNYATIAWADGGSGVHVDDASITTNYSHGAVVDGNASLYGFRTAYAGDVPHKKVDGTIEWKPVAAGGALLVQGNYDSTVATCTNKLIFASESDSNVKFKVTKGANGSVTVTVGVYWAQ